MTNVLHNVILLRNKNSQTHNLSNRKIKLNEQGVDLMFAYYAGGGGGGAKISAKVDRMMEFVRKFDWHITI